MRWMLIGLVVSVVALLLVAGAMVRYVVRHRRVRGDEPAAVETVLELGSDGRAGVEAEDPEDSAVSGRTGER